MGRCEDQSDSAAAMHQGDRLVPTAEYLASKLQDQFKQVSTVSARIRIMVFITQALCMSYSNINTAMLRILTNIILLNGM
jgi:hypothetical protein